MKQQPYLKQQPFSYTQSYQHYDHMKLTPERVRQKSRSPTKSQSKMSRTTKVDNLIKGLFRKHDEMKQRLEVLKKQKEADDLKQLEKYNYTPQITHSKRYQPSGTFQSRNQDLIKDRKQFRQEQSEKKQKQQTKPCPFRPTLIAGRKSMQILERKRLREQSLNELRDAGDRQQSFQLQMKESRKVKSKSPNQPKPLSALKYLIKTELRRIELI